MICPCCRAALLPQDAKRALYVRAHDMTPVCQMEIPICKCCVARAETHPREIQTALARVYDTTIN